jgi:DNA-binding transcriptional MerR regulator
VKTDNTTMTIREMCDAFDVTPRTLRFYETKELLFPIREGSRRLYTRQCRARLKLILRGKRFGFSLEEVRHLLELYDLGGATQLAKTYELAGRHLTEMEARRIELDQAITELRAEMAWGAAELARLNRNATGAAA